VAFRKYPLYFDNLYCNLVEAGESAGILDQLLDRLAVYMEKTEAIKSKIKSALMYPITVLVVAFVVVSVIMIFVIPAFKEVFTNFGGDLPVPTLVVIAMSEFFVQVLVPDLRRPGRRRLLLHAGLETQREGAEFHGPLAAEVADLRRAGREILHRTLDPHLSTMFAAGVPLVEALDSVGRRVRQLGVRARHGQDPA
jgi:type IV pilus assembly protein PilC